MSRGYFVEQQTCWEVFKKFVIRKEKLHNKIFLIQFLECSMTGYCYSFFAFWLKTNPGNNIQPYYIINCVKRYILILLCGDTCQIEYLNQENVESLHLEW